MIAAAVQNLSWVDAVESTIPAVCAVMTTLGGLAAGILLSDRRYERQARQARRK